MRISMWAMTVFVATTARAQAVAPPAAAPPVIVTTGSGDVQVTPDRATILFAVETRGATAAAASQENARLQRQVIDALRKQGLGQDEISTMGYSVNPEMRYDSKEPRVIGYVARNTVRAEVRRIDQTGSL